MERLTRRGCRTPQDRRISRSRTLFPEADSQPAQVEPLEPSRGKKALNRVISILTTVIFVVALAFTLVVVATTLSSRGGEATFFGWKPLHRAFRLHADRVPGWRYRGVARRRHVDARRGRHHHLRVHRSDNYGEIYTHKIRERTTYEGQSAFVTYGTTTGDDDLCPALESKVVGEYVFAIPKAGYVFDFFKSPAGYVVLVLIPFSILIGLQVRNIVRLVKDGRASQSAALAAEQQRVREMQEEIDRLRSGAEAPVSGQASRGASGSAAFSGDAMREPRARAAAAGLLSPGRLRTWRQRGLWHLRVVRMTLVPHVAWPLRRVRIERLRWLTLNGRLIRLSRNGGRHSDEARAVRGSGEEVRLRAPLPPQRLARGRRLPHMRPARRLCEMFRRVVRMWSRDTVGRCSRLASPRRFGSRVSRKRGDAGGASLVARAARASVEVASSPRLGAFSSAPWRTRALRDLTSERRR